MTNKISLDNSLYDNYYSEEGQIKLEKEKEEFMKWCKKNKNNKNLTKAKST